jgi:hypothetical protein
MEATASPIRFPSLVPPSVASVTSVRCFLRNAWSALKATVSPTQFPSLALPLVIADIVFVNEDPELLVVGEVTVFFLDVRYDLGAVPVLVIVVGITYKKIKIEVK